MSKFKTDKTIKSTDYKTVYAEFEVLVDTDLQPPVIGLMVDPVHGKPFILPMTPECAHAISETMLRTLLKTSPQLFAQYAR